MKRVKRSLKSPEKVPLECGKQKLWRNHTFPRVKEESGPALPVAHNSLKNLSKGNTKMQSFLIWVQPPETLDFHSSSYEKAKH